MWLSWSTSLRPVEGTDDVDCKLNADYNEHGTLFKLTYLCGLHRVVFCIMGVDLTVTIAPPPLRIKSLTPSKLPRPLRPAWRLADRRWRRPGLRRVVGQRHAQVLRRRPAGLGQVDEQRLPAQPLIAVALVPLRRRHPLLLPARAGGGAVPVSEMVPAVADRAIAHRFQPPGAGSCLLLRLLMRGAP